MGSARAFEIAYLGERIGAEQALGWNMVNEVVDDDQLEQRVSELAARLAAGPPGSYASIKRTINDRAYAGFEQLLDLEADEQQERAESNDFREGVLAFVAEAASQVRRHLSAPIRGASMNLAQILIDSWRRDPDHVAIKLDDAELNYAQLNGASAHFVGLLREHGFQHGDRVGIMLPNVPYFPVCYYGVLRAGGVVVPMNVLLKQREVAFYLKDSGARLLFAWDGFADDAQAGADEAGAECILVKAGRIRAPGRRGAAVHPRSPTRDDGDTAVILYTSGTTGTPKGAELSHANLTRNATRCRKAVRRRTPRRSRSERCRYFTRSGRRAG